MFLNGVEITLSNKYYWKLNFGHLEITGEKVYKILLDSGFMKIGQVQFLKNSTSDPQRNSQNKHWSI